VSIFQEAWTRREDLLDALRYLGTFEHRVQRRYRLLDRPIDDPLAIKLERRMECRGQIHAEAAHASRTLDLIWNFYSRCVPPLVGNLPGCDF
jgi:hypothetical protein